MRELFFSKGGFKTEAIPIKCSSPYNVYIGKNILKSLSELIKKAYSSILIVTDDNVDKYYSEIIAENLKVKFNIYKYVFPHGEKSKSLNEYIKLTEYMSSIGLDRNSLIIALGGGVTGDLSGFAAATYMRGIDFIQIPTSLLAMVDSSVGGKTAIDTPFGKNILGAFYQPQFVLCDTACLKTLPDEFLKDGMGEIVKYGILSENIFKKLNTGFLENKQQIISDCIKLKAEIVANDEFDIGQRQLLNLGHTLGHSLELLSNFTISHGNAVAKGLHMIAEFSYKNNLCSEVAFNKIRKLLQFYNFNLEIPYTYREIFDIIKYDKKKNGEFINLIIPTDIGNCKIMKFSFNQIHQMIQE